MTDAGRNERRDFYVYAWRRPNGEPFYIGKGRGNRDVRIKSRNTIFMRIVSKIRASGQEPVVERVFDGLTEGEAFTAEIAMIAKYGRIDVGSGILANMTHGGEGSSGYISSKEVRAKLSAANRSGAARGGTFKGVSFAKGRGKFQAQIRIDGKTKCLGFYDLPQDAARVYDAAAYEAWGPLARLNFPEKIGEALPQRLSNAGAQRLAPPNGKNKSGFKGVSLHAASGKYNATITLNGKRTNLGYYPAPVEAALAYDVAAIAAWGMGNCYLNFPRTYTN